MSLASGTRLGPYEILAAIGAGGMGEVYRARDTKLDREVAIKILPEAFAADAERLARFDREAKVLAALNHPNIAAIYGLEEGALVMELVEGEMPLGPLPLDTALDYARQIAAALEAAHDKGIVHRDLKPANIKITPAGVVKVLDFGLAAVMQGSTPGGSDPAASPTLTMGATQAGVILGTAGYMAPEQARGKAVDKRADIWAFGVVLYEMIAGRRLFHGEDISDTLASVIKEEPRWDGIPVKVQRLLKSCLEKDPKRRLRDIGDAWRLMEEAPPAEIRGSAPRGSVLLPWALFALASLAAFTAAFLHWREASPAQRVLRYSVAAPPKGMIHSFALSPDGRYLAMAIVIEGNRQLWIRPLDALQTQLLPGTDGAQHPFWSPDSRQVGFFAEGKLKKIAVAGGPAQTLCDAPDGRGGTWNRDGVIVFSLAAASPLQRVSSVGGVPASVTKDVSAMLRRFPAFLPDGSRFLYMMAGAAEKSGVYLGSLDGQPARRLLADVSPAAYVAPPIGNRKAHLLFLREGTLMSQPVEPDTLDPAGEVFPIAEHVFTTSLGWTAMSVSEEGTLAYKVGASVGEGQLVWYDRSGKELSKVGTPSNILAMALSPDEKVVAVARSQTDVRSGCDIWLHEIARGADTRLTVHASLNLTPVWSPDGRRILFASSRNGPFALYTKDTSGSGQDELFSKSELGRFACDWSPDGRLAMYVNTDTKTKWDLWTMPVSGERKPVPFLQTEFNECQARFSPDGAWVAYASDESGRYEIYARPFPPAAGKSKISIAGGQFPRWRRDGKELFYLSPELKLMSVAIKTVPGRNATLEPGVPQALFDSHAVTVPAGFNNFQYAVAGDGKRFLVTTVGKQATEESVTMVTNWLNGVKR